MGMSAQVDTAEMSAQVMLVDTVDEDMVEEAVEQDVDSFCGSKLKLATMLLRQLYTSMLFNCIYIHTYMYTLDAILGNLPLPLVATSLFTLTVSQGRLRQSLLEYCYYHIITGF